MPKVRHEDLEINYMEWGRKEDPVIMLVHGLMLSSPLFSPLATRLKGWRIIAVDVRGHGGSSRPRDASRYSWGSLASDVLAVMDSLGIERAVIGGVSLGANVTLEFAHRYPERLSALIVEMPVLSMSEGVARTVFGLVASALRRAGPVLNRPTAWIRGLPVPSGPPELVLLRNIFSMDAVASSALIEGLQVSPVPLHDAQALSAIRVPTLVIGHRLDPIHHHDDAVDLASMIRSSELVSALTIADFRFFPNRYAATIAAFLRRRVEIGGSAG